MNPAISAPKIIRSAEKRVQHHPALPAEKIHEFFTRLSDYPNRTTQLALRLLILTFVRVGELRQGEWSELHGNEWHIPAEKMKMKRPRIVPLSDWALETLDELVCQACIELLAGERAQSITFDNGKEFAQHRSIAEALDTEVYFARPYHSWERGSNENANGLIRQFLPKSVSLDNLTAEFVQTIEDNLNNRPRKVLGFQTPLEVKSRFGRVALRC